MPILDWHNRSQHIRAAAQAPFCALSAVRNPVGNASAQNILVHGDNLLALKALVPHYAGAVDCVFIDPPYNTRKDFPHYQDNLEHTQWLEMMFPRLVLLHELLADNGSIWVIIDDDEAHYLKVLMDEIFGRKNFVANVVWEKKASPQANAQWLSDSHDHILVYAKGKAGWRPNLLPRPDESNLRYANPDNDPRGPWASSDFTISLTGGQRGAQYAKTGVSENIYEIVTPSGRKIMPTAGRCWASGREKYAEYLKDGRMWFGEKGNNVPRKKTFLADVEKSGVVSKTIWFRDDVGDNQESKREVKAFDNNSIFATPKPERLIMRVLQLATREGDLVLDSFLGSGTTAAVAHKTGRRWIGIEMGDHAETHCVPRLRAVVAGKDPGGVTEAAGWKGGGGFRFARLGPPVFTEEGEVNPAIRFPELAAHIWFSEARVPLPRGRKPGPYLGAHKGRGYALLYNGILKDKRANGGNILTRRTLAECRTAASAGELPADAVLVIYGNGNRLSPATMRRARAEFRQIPYEVKKR